MVDLGDEPVLEDLIGVVGVATQKFIDGEIEKDKESGDGEGEEGETEGETIWVLRGLPYSELVETLLHEALHDSCFIRRPTRTGNLRGLTEDLEHDVMDPILFRIFLEECQ